MIVINKNYLHFFIRSRIEYLYPINKGVYLAFDRKSLEYIGLEMFVLYSNKIEKQEDKKLKELISKGILEVI